MALKRFTVREEYFGSLIYDREKRDYIPFDAEGTAVFRETAAGMPISEVYESFCSKKNSRQSFDTFVNLCRSIGLLDENGVFDGRFIPAAADPEAGCLSAPLRVHLQITNECPMKCRHCSQHSREPLDNELTSREIFALLDEMAQTGVQEITLGGGEPFCKDELIGIVAKASAVGVVPSISASGLLVSRASAKKLAESGVKQVRISFDGSSEKTYDYYRGKGTYRRAIRGIKTIREIFDCPLVIHSVIMKPNMGELLSLFKAVQKLDADVWSVDFFRPSGSAGTLSNFMLTPDDAALVIKTLRRFSETSGMKIRMPARPCGSSSSKLFSGFGCPAGRMSCFIDSRGNVKPCSFFPQSYVAGNIRSAPLKKIWLEGAAFRELRDLKGNDTCLSCPSFKSCRGGCRARSISGGNAESPDPLCPVAAKKH